MANFEMSEIPYFVKSCCAVPDAVGVTVGVGVGVTVESPVYPFCRIQSRSACDVPAPSKASAPILFWLKYFILSAAPKSAQLIGRAASPAGAVTVGVGVVWVTVGVGVGVTAGA